MGSGLLQHGVRILLAGTALAATAPLAAEPLRVSIDARAVNEPVSRYQYGNEFYLFLR